MRHLFKTLAAGVGAALSLSAAAYAQDAPLGQRLDAAIDRAIAEKRIVGTVVVVMQDGKVIYRRAAARPTARPVARWSPMRSSGWLRSPSRS